MPDLMTMLPFLNGWKYVLVDEIETITSSNLEVWSDKISQAWLLGAILAATDAFAQIIVTFPPEELKLTAVIADEYNAGITVPVPSSGFYVPLYNQPSPSNTAGDYNLIFSTYPLALPPHTTFRVSASLASGTTEQSAYAEISLIYVKVIDETAFLDSLKEKFGLNA